MYMQMPTPAQLNTLRLPNTVLYGFEFTAVEPYATATITQNEHNSQHTGVIQGGVLCVLAETLANMAAQLSVNSLKANRYLVLGQSLNTSYLRSAKGVITATAVPLHSGKQTSVYSVEMTDESGELVAVSTFTGGIVKRRG